MELRDACRSASLCALDTREPRSAIRRSARRRLSSAEARALLDEAVARYERETGERADAAVLGSHAAAHTQRAYRHFARAAQRIPFPAIAGEEAALTIGLKPALRLLIDPSRVAQLAARFRSRGFATTWLPLPLHESSIDGATSCAPAGDAEARVPFYVGRDAKRIEDAAQLESWMSLDGGLARGDLSQATRRLGELLGYPRCCIEAFAALGPTDLNVEPVRAAADRTVTFDPLLDNLSLSVCHLIGWFPCRYDCEPSREVARAVERKLAAEVPTGIAALRRYLAMPRLYCDDRRQIVFDGKPGTSTRVHYRSVHTPYAFDRRPEEAAYEWVFFASVVAPLLEGEQVTMEPDALIVERRGRRPWRVPRPRGSVWLPFSERDASACGRAGE